MLSRERISVDHSSLSVGDHMAPFETTWMRERIDLRSGLSRPKETPWLGLAYTSAGVCSTIDAVAVKRRA